MRTSRGFNVSASIEINHNLIRLLVRPWPRVNLLPTLLILPLHSIMAFIGLLGNLILLCIIPFQYVGAFISADIVGISLLPCAGLSALIDCIRCAIRFPQTIYETFKSLFYLTTGRPYAYIPAGLRIHNNVIGEFNEYTVVQVLDINISDHLLRLTTPRKKRGFINRLFWLFFLPVTLPWSLLKALADRLLSGRVTRILAIVIGEPIDLDHPEKPRRWWKKKAERTVFLITLDPDHAETVLRHLERTLGKARVLLRDNELKRLWGISTNS